MILISSRFTFGRKYTGPNKFGHPYMCLTNINLFLKTKSSLRQKQALDLSAKCGYNEITKKEAYHMN